MTWVVVALVFAGLATMVIGSAPIRLPGVPYKPRFSSDEIILGVVVGIMLHVLAIGPFVLKAILPHGPDEEETPIVARPVVQASLLKLGKPLDPKKLPDRLVPQQRTAPKKQIVASREDPKHPNKPDAGPPPDNVRDSDIANLIAKSDPFAEDAGKKQPDEGRAEGVDGGTETDPNKVNAGNEYLRQLGEFFGKNLSVPSVISVGEARRLCVVYRVNINRTMIIWHVQNDPIKSSGNPLFDDAARSMLLKLLDDRTRLPEPPKDFEDQVRGQPVQVAIPGDPHGDSSRCK